MNMASSQVYAPAPRWMYVLLLFPVLALGLVLIAGINLMGALAGVVSIYAVFAVALRLPGKYPALVLAGVVWLAIFEALLGGIRPELGFAGLRVLCIGGLAMGWVVLAGRLAVPWAHARAQRMAAKGRPIIEWEWVYTGRGFALSHPLARVRGGVICVVLYVALQMAAFGICAPAFFAAGGVGTFGTWGGVGVCTLSLVALLCRSPVAYVLVWIQVLFVPFHVYKVCVTTGMATPLEAFILFILPVLPLTFYWADGVRPNLLYRHRFERLVPHLNTETIPDDPSVQGVQQ